MVELQEIAILYKGRRPRKTPKVEPSKPKGLISGTGFLGVLSVGLIIIFMVIGGGLALPFMKIPWYVWMGLLFVFVLYLSRK